MNTEFSLEGLMLKLKCQYFAHLMWRANSLEKTLMLGKIEGKRRSGCLRWLDSTTSSWVWANSEIVKRAWCALVCGVTKSQTWLSDWTRATTMARPLLVYPFIHQWTVELLPLLAIMNNIAITRSIAIFLQDLPFNYSGYLPRTGSARSCGNSVSLFEQQPYCFSWHLPCFTFLPTGQECFTLTKVKTKVSLSPHPHQQLLSYFFS